MARLETILGLLFSFAIAIPTRAEPPDQAELRAALANDSIPLPERSRRVLEGASSLDQAAQRPGPASERRGRWSQAVGLLDEFLEKHPEVEAAPLIRFQAGVYRWAEGRSFAEQAELTPSDSKLREGAIRALDDATSRLRGISIKPEDRASTFAQNLRFRLAQAIADRSKVEPEGDPKRATLDREALAVLEPPPTMPGLVPFVRLLRGELSARLGLFGQAQMEVEQAEKLNPSPPAASLLEVKVATLAGRARFEEAAKLIEGSRVGDPLKRLLSLRVALARRKEKPPGRERKEIDDEAFRIAERVRGGDGMEDRRALMELARTIDEPGPDAPPEWWDLLALGHARLGDAVRAGRLEAKGADRAEASAGVDRAANLRYKAGAFLFEAGRYLEADQRLSQVADRPGTTSDIRAKAGMLRALARGRALATHQPGSSRASYLGALETQIREFPDDPCTGEARWLLGQVRIEAGKLEEALVLCSAIPHASPRWLEARTLIADRQREAVEAQRINRDSAAVVAKMEVARKALRESMIDAKDSAEVVAISLLVARLELTPDSGRPPLAIEACEKVLRIAARPDQHRVARLYRMVALAQGGRTVEAEQVARAESKIDDPASLLPSLRLLDRASSEAEAEATRRRIGLVARVITTRILDQIDQIPEKSRDEVQLHHARALLFSGDPAAAKKVIAAWGGPVVEIDDEMARELADTYQRLDAFALAIEAERYRSNRLAPGSLPWFEARYGMALAYYRSDRPNDARQLIDATAILHPDLGGGELKTRFERLRQRIGKP